MTSIAFFVIITSLVALVAVGTEDMGSGHKVFANRDSSGHVTNRGINVQTDTNQDQGCESAGVTSAITNACTATSGRGSTETSTETQITLSFNGCDVHLVSLECDGGPIAPDFCNNIGCLGIACNGPSNNPGDCTTDNGVHLTSCTFINGSGRFAGIFTCTRTETQTIPGTGITQSGGVTGDS